MNVLELFNKISTFVFDVDGVLTDGTVLVMQNGLQARRMHIKDGFALQMALKNGFRVKVISGGNSPEVKERLANLGITDVDMQVMNKAAHLSDYIKKHKLKKEELLYMGDDLPDIPAMQIVGLPCCPADAVHEVKEVCRYVSHLDGGHACVREVIEKVLKLHNKWQYRGDLASR